MAGILAGEIFVERVSRSANDAIPKLDGINFALHQRAEGLLLEPDFTVRIAHDPECLSPYRMAYDENFIKRELETHGGSLADMTAPCVEHAVRSFTTVQEILQHPECKRTRAHQNWDRKENWLDRVNTGLGYALWRPVPIIGLGARMISNLTSYNGIFCRDKPEGYGLITWTNGDTYYGQVRDGWERGYGVKHFADGRVLVGYFNDFSLGLGVSLSPERDRVYYGAHSNGKLSGYGRQIGLRDGLDSVTGFWQQGVLSGTGVPMHSDTFRRIAKNLSKNPNLRDLAAEYWEKAATTSALREAHDQSILSVIRQFL